MAEIVENPAPFEGVSFLELAALFSVQMALLFWIFWLAGPWINPDYPYDLEPYVGGLSALAIVLCALESGVRRIEKTCSRDS